MTLSLFVGPWSFWWVFDVVRGNKPRRLSAGVSGTAAIVDVTSSADTEQAWALSGALAVAVSFAIFLAIADLVDDPVPGFVVASLVTLMLRSASNRLTLGTGRGLLEDHGEKGQWTSFADFSSSADQSRSGPLITWLASAVVTTLGVWCLLVTALKIAWRSDTLFTPIPGLFAHHSHKTFSVAVMGYLSSGLLSTRLGSKMSRQAVIQMRQVPVLRTKFVRGGDDLILLLRSFADDAMAVVAHRSGPTAFSLGALSASRSALLEDVVGSVLRTRGSIFACGDPREAHSAGGLAATRFTIRDRPWEYEVSEMISTARVIVVIAGVTPGLATELGEIQVRGALAKTVVVFPPCDRFTMTRRVEVVEEQLGLGLELPFRGSLLAAVFKGGAWVPICSRAADDIDYRCAVRRALDELADHSARRNATH